MGELPELQPLFIIRYFLNSENAMFTASELLERINSHIAELQFVRTPQGLYAPVTYVLSMGGKRIRPVLMLMAYNLYQEDITRIFNLQRGLKCIIIISFARRLDGPCRPSPWQGDST